MTPKEVYWQDLLGNKYRVALHPAMLVGDGYRVYMSNKQVGDSKADKSKFGIVRFDRLYVLNFLIRKVFHPLKLQTSDEAIALAKEACLAYLYSLDAQESHSQQEEYIQTDESYEIPFDDGLPF